MYPCHTIPSHVRKILFSIVLHSTTMTSKCLLSFRSSVRKFVCISLFSRATCFDLITLMSGEEYKFWRARYTVYQDKVFLTNPGNEYYCRDDSEIKAPRPARLDSSLHITLRPGKRGSLFSSFLLLWSATCWKSWSKKLLWLDSWTELFILAAFTKKFGRSCSVQLVKCNLFRADTCDCSRILDTWTRTSVQLQTSTVVTCWTGDTLGLEPVSRRMCRPACHENRNIVSISCLATLLRVMTCPCSCNCQCDGRLAETVKLVPCIGQFRGLNLDMSSGNAMEKWRSSETLVRAKPNDTAPEDWICEIVGFRGGSTELFRLWVITRRKVTDPLEDGTDR